MSMAKHCNGFLRMGRECRGALVTMAGLAFGHTRQDSHKFLTSAAIPGQSNLLLIASRVFLRPKMSCNHGIVGQLHNFASCNLWYHYQTFTIDLVWSSH